MDATETSLIIPKQLSSLNLFVIKVHYKRKSQPSQGLTDKTYYGHN